MIQTDSDNILYSILSVLYRNSFKHEAVSFEPLYAHGSDRNIVRIHSESQKPVIGIHSNDEAENRAFIGYSKHFKSQGLNVPEIYNVSEDTHFYLMEDLGDTTLFKKISEDKVKFSRHNIELYKQAIKNLIRFQTEAGRTIDYGLCYQFSEFGKDNIEFDLNYFKQRFLENFYKKELDVSRLENELDFLKQKLLEQPRDYFLYRDFQSRNIMLLKNDLYFIDYQSGRRGALQYDIASLMYDARADVPQNLRESLLEYYIQEAGKCVKIDADEFSHYFWYFAMVRILQAMGAYGFLGITKGKKRFLDSIPYAVKNINFMLSKRINKSEFSYLKNIFSEINYEPV